VNRWQVQIFYDGDCPLCRREVAWMRRRDHSHRISFVDISDDNFNAEQWGKTWDDLMARIHGRLPDGNWIEGVEVFRRAYTALGWGPVVALTRWPVVRTLLDFGYRVFAKHRLSMTGRGYLSECLDGRCHLPSLDTEATGPHSTAASRNIASNT
jgi:predicted DCC family thiol-disulfide oxidoreductase YuxK